MENQFIEDSFDRYIKHVFQKINLDDWQKAEIRKAFFSGVCVTFDVIEKLSTECRIQDLTDFFTHTKKEINKFDHDQLIIYEEMIGDKIDG